MASLTNTKIKDTYDGLLKTTDNDALGGTYKLITDGLGNSSGVYLGTGGNVGIGTSNPSRSLTVYSDVGSTNILGVFDNSGTTAANCVIAFSDPNSTAGQFSTRLGSVGDALAFYTNGANERMRITSGGVGIGTSSPTMKMHINGDTSAMTQVGISNTSTGEARIYFDASNGDFSGNDYFSIGQQNDLNGIIDLAPAADLRILTNGSERMRIDSSGNVGIGVTPEAWTVFDPVLRIGDGGAFSGTDVSNFRMFANTYYDGSYKRIGSGFATQYEQASGTHVWSTAATGSANSTITWSERMRIDSSGRVAIGTSSIITDTIFALHEGNVDLEFSLDNAVADTARIFAFDRGTTTHKNLQLRANQTEFYSGASEKMRIDSSGNVGIGTSSPAAKLEIFGSGNTLRLDSAANQSKEILFRNVGSGTAVIKTDGDLRLDAEDAGKTIQFNTVGSERMRITSGGDVLVATTSSTAPHTLTSGEGLMINSGRYLSIARGSDSLFLNRTGSNGGVARFYRDGGTDVGSISVTTTSTAYNTSSDYRLKENVVDMTGALDRVDQLEPKRFNFIADEDTTVDGFLAHEVQDIVPEAVTGEKDAVDEDGNDIYQGIDQSKLVPLLVGAIKELKAEIETLKSQINS